MNVLDDSPVSLMSLLADHRMCLPCLAERLDMSPDLTRAALAVIEPALPIRQKSRTCPFCGVYATVYSLDAPIPLEDRP